MKFFSKLVVYCNFAFIATAILRLVEMRMRAKGNKDALIPLPFVEGTIVILGTVAIIINLFFLLFIVIKKLTKQPVFVSKVIIWFNVILFFVQVWYHFFSKI
jgi:hypothetical protein